MSENKKETENSSSSLNENKILNVLPELIDLNKTKKKFYYLFKNGTKYIVKQKEKGKKILKEIKNDKLKKPNLEQQIYKKFISKYDKMPNNYNSYIICKLMHNINCHIVALFKEYLIDGDIFEFLTKYYKKNKSAYLLKEIIEFYNLNNVLYPNYVILPEGNYIFKNIQQKQRIIDTQEENLKKREKEKDKYKYKEIKVEEKDDILTSKVIDSILNQTNTSEARKDFDINNNSTELEEYNKINSLIKNIDKAEEINRRNKIFQKKKLIRIVNKELKGNAFYKMCHYINKNNNFYLTIKNDNIKYNIIKDNILSNNISPKPAIIGRLIPTSSPNENINKKRHNSYNIDFNIYLNKHKKTNTIEVNQIEPRKKILLTESKEDNSDGKNSNLSFLNFNTPYVAKKPIKQSTSYNRKKIYNKISNNNKIYLKKTSNSINKFNNFQYSPFKNYFNTDTNDNDKDNNDNEVKIYKKKLNKINRRNTETNFNSNLNRKVINTDVIINRNINKKKNEKIYRNLIKSRNNQKYVNTTNMNVINNNNEEQNKIVNKKNLISKPSLSINRSNYKKIEKYSNHTFKSIAKMIKRKYIIDDDESNNHNIYDNNTYHSQQKYIINAPLTSRNENIEKNPKLIENNNHSKNIYISNNITNNNYYTIDNNSKYNTKLLIKKFTDKTEINRRKKNNILNIENKHDALEYLNTDSNIVNNIKLNNNSENEDYSKRIKTELLSPYKSGLISKTTLKSLDKYSLKYLLNRFNEKNNSKGKNEGKNQLKINKDNYQLNNNNTINNTQNDGKAENKIRLKKRYLILRDNRNGNNIKNIKKSHPIDQSEKNNINQKNELYKTSISFNSNKLKLSSLSTKNNKRNNKINLYY